MLLNCVDPPSDLPAVLPDERRRAAGRRPGPCSTHGVDEAIYVVGEDPTPDAIAGPARLDGVRADPGRRPVRELAGVVACDVGGAGRRTTRCRAAGRGCPPRGLICLNDRVAMGVYQALADYGLGVPHDVAVVSFDGSELATWLRPRLASVALPFAEMGRRAVEILLDAAYDGPRARRVPDAARGRRCRSLPGLVAHVDTRRVLV